MCVAVLFLCVCVAVWLVGVVVVVIVVVVVCRGVCAVWRVPCVPAPRPHVLPAHTGRQEHTYTHINIRMNTHKNSVQTKIHIYAHIHVHIHFYTHMFIMNHQGHKHSWNGSVICLFSVCC